MYRTVRLLPVLFLLCFSMSSCFSIREEIHINNDGSGTYTTGVDLGKMMAMLQMFSAEMGDALGGEKQDVFSGDKDTAFTLKSFTDTSTTLTDAEKKIMEKGTMRLISNAADGVFDISATVPFSNTAEMAGISLSNGKKTVLDILFNATGSNKNNMSATNDNTPPPFEMIYEAGHIERKFIPEIYERLKDKMRSDENDEEAKKMFEGNNFTTVIHFEKPIKKAKGKYTKVSEDGKTVTVEIPFLDFISNPKDITYSIDY